jgi:hypothetical protein
VGQPNSGQCLAVSTCAAADGDLVTVLPCGGGVGPVNPLAPCSDATSLSQQWQLTGPGNKPPNALITVASGRCLDVNGAFQSNHIDVWDCGNPPGQYANEEWAYNATTGAITSLDTAHCCAGRCLTVTPV